jgi:hypothetical protein
VAVLSEDIVLTYASPNLPINFFAYFVKENKIFDIESGDPASAKYITHEELLLVIYMQKFDEGEKKAGDIHFLLFQKSMADTVTWFGVYKAKDFSIGNPSPWAGYNELEHRVDFLVYESYMIVAICNNERVFRVRWNLSKSLDI